MSGNLMNWVRRAFSSGKTGAQRRRQEDFLPKDQELKTAMADALLADILRERQSEQSWRKVRRSIFVGIAATSFFMYVFFYATALGYKVLPRTHTVAVVRVHGEIGADSQASAAKIIPVLKRAFELPSVQAIILSIDSPGGQPVEAERIYRAIAEMRKENPKPVVAAINNMGASAPTCWQFTQTKFMQPITVWWAPLALSLRDGIFTKRWRSTTSPSMCTHRDR